jgi:hypothetical protein
MSRVAFRPSRLKAIGLAIGLSGASLIAYGASPNGLLFGQSNTGEFSVADSVLDQDPDRDPPRKTRQADYPPPPPRGDEDGEEVDDRLPPPPPPPFGPPPPVMHVLDADHDGILSASEIKNASQALLTLDKNGDGKLTREELRPPRPPGPPAAKKKGARGREPGPPPPPPGEDGPPPRPRDRSN